jgi:beta-phosphoglucomutase-like phosphatase (HAD superfamily)
MDSCGEPGLLEWFEVIAAGDVVAAKKPAPDIFQLVLDELGLPPEACVAVEDSDNGVRSALGADLRALLVTVSTYTRDQDFSGSGLVVDGLGEPGEPMQVLSGACGAEGIVDLTTLSDMHRRVYGAGGSGG